MIFVRKILFALFLTAIVLLGMFAVLVQKPIPEKISYGVSFNTQYVHELGLDLQETYLAILDDLQVKHVRLAAHWDLVEPQRNSFDFSEIDFQVAEAAKRDVDVILGVGRRLPRWPECHTPEWAKNLSQEEQQAEILKYIDAVVKRYKKYDNIIYWQVENEPFLEVFAKEYCGELNVDFLDKEIALVRELDPGRPILLTDSGNLGTWYKPYKRGDAFGTSVYVYLWNPEVGPFKSFLPPETYRLKEKLVSLVYGKKPTFLIELSLEPWLLNPITETSVATQLERMDVAKMNEIIEYAKNTRFENQYLWGAEWWYLMKKQGHPEFWVRGKELFAS